VSLNVGGIYVKAKRGVDPKRVRAAIAAYWTERGAAAADVWPREPLALEGTRELAFAVMPGAGGWICIADSERYNADFGLANHLATALATQVIWYTLYGATDAGVLRVLGPGRKPRLPDDDYGAVEAFVTERLPHPFVYLDQLPESERALRFANVDPAAYDRGPVPADEEEVEPAAPPASVPVDDPAKWPVPVDPSLVAANELRVGYLVAFFLPGLFAKHVHDVRGVFERWVDLVPRDALQWSLIGSSATGVKPFGAQTLERCRAQLTTKAAAKYAAFRLGGPEPSHPQYEFHLDGAADDDDDVERGSASSIEVVFPWTTPHETVASFAMAAAEQLAYATGLATPALFFDADLVGAAGRPVAARLAARYPGLELGVDGFKLGDKMHGAHWLVFLGPTQVRALGRVEAPDLEVEPAGHGVCLRASGAPELGDALAGDIPAGLRTIAQLVAPVTAAPPDFARQAGPRTTIELEDGSGTAFEAFERELGARWSARFTEDGTALRALVEQLAVLERLERDPTKHLVDLPKAPYLSEALGLALLPLLRDRAVAERIVARFPATELLQFASSRDRIQHLLATPDIIPWLLAQATGPDRARTIATIGAALVGHDPARAPAVIAAMPADADQHAWDILLRPINNQLGSLHAKDPPAAERLSDAIQPVAKHDPQIYLWTATIFIARGRVEDAMTQIELMFAAGYRDKKRILRDKDFAPLYKHPRFLALKES
jgi:hypothetical protein